MPPNYINLLNPTRPIHPLHKSLKLVIERCLRLGFAIIVYPIVFSIWSVRHPLNMTWFSLIPTRIAYIWDRYIVHASPCLLRKVIPGMTAKKEYVFDGITLSKMEGFNDYVVRKKSSLYSAVPNTQISTGFEAPQDSVSRTTNIEEEEIKNPEFATNQKITSILELNTPEEDSVATLDEIVSNKPDKIISRDCRARRQKGKKKHIFVRVPNAQQQIKVIVKRHKLKGKGRSNRLQQTNNFRFVGSTTSASYINKVKNAINFVFKSAPEYDDGSLAPIILRLSWHCCATYDKHTNSGGSNGATMRFIPEITDEGNTGLDIARAALEPIKQEFPLLSYSDLWTLSGVLALQNMCEALKLTHLQIKWLPGRVDCFDNNKVPPNGRLPFADKDANHIRSTFDRMGFNIAETVALCGAHGIGRCHKRFSGWEGKWTKNPIVFSNDFFRTLLNEEWHEDIVPESGRVQYYNEDKLLMMLNTDMELVRDPEFREWVERYASDEQLFFRDFSSAFSKLLELGIERDPVTSAVIVSSIGTEPEK